MDQAKGRDSKEKKGSKNCGKRILELVWRYKNHNGLWFAFLNVLSTVKYLYNVDS